jgi:hypothetical protein
VFVGPYGLRYIGPTWTPILDESALRKFLQSAWLAMGSGQEPGIGDSSVESARNAKRIRVAPDALLG